MRLRLPGSLAGRLLAASSLLIVVFLSVTAVALDHAFRDSSEGATQDLLRSRVLGLLAAADVGDAGGVVMRGDLPEERFFRPGSGLYARFIAAGGREAWSSPSLVSGGFPPGEPVEPGEAVYDRVIGAGDEALARLRFGVAWEIGPGEPAVYTVSVAESLDAYFEDLSRFRREIGAWFAGLGLALLAVQWWLLSFLLRPVRQAESEIGEMEQGRRESLSEGYPKELEALTSRLNALVASERSRVARYRSTLDDLAHSLKTPLAVLRTLLSRRGGTPAEVEQALERMDDIVAYRLSRVAATGGARVGAARVPVAELAAATAGALAKVHAERAVEWSLDTPDDLVYVGDRGDLAEILGNLMDNACKWGRGHARLEIAADGDGGRILVEDDGPGLPGEIGELLERGARGDTTAPGQGIGLAVVRDIVGELGGHLAFGESPLGGARIEVRLPAGRLVRRGDG
jgi:two-component system sensor histidine kinase PhoQ